MYYRKLVAFDREQLHAHYLRLSAIDRRLRFFSMVSDAFLDRYAHKVIAYRRVCIGGFVDGRLRAAGELALDAAYPYRLAAEIALSVEEAHRGQGVGRQLMDSLVTVARNRGVRDIAVPCLPDNYPMRAMIAKFAGHGVIAAGVYDAHIDAPWPTPLSGWKEALQDFTGAQAQVLARMYA